MHKWKIFLLAGLPFFFLEGLFSLYLPSSRVRRFTPRSSVYLSPSSLAGAADSVDRIYDGPASPPPQPTRHNVNPVRPYTCRNSTSDRGSAGSKTKSFQSNMLGFWNRFENCFLKYHREADIIGVEFNVKKILIIE